MSHPSPAIAAQLALSGRLRAVAPFLLEPADVPAVSIHPSVDAAELFDATVAAVEADQRDDKIWLLLSALSAVYPRQGEVNAARRRFELDSPIMLRMHLLDSALAQVQEAGTALTQVEVIVGGTIVDVDHSAKHDLHTGIQRVVRNLLPLWDTDHIVVPAAWAGRTTALRRLTTGESDRVVRWSTTELTRSSAPAGAARHRVNVLTAPRQVVVLPWRSVVVMAEVPPVGANDRLAELGGVSGNRLVGIAYDAIPIVSADAVPPIESIKFARYLTAVKFASRVAGISRAAAAEMDGFVRMLPTQGLTGPAVCEVSLPAAGLPSGAPAPAVFGSGPSPKVLAVGSHEPRKNHLAILFAAEVLWREGMQFSLEFIGGSGWGDDFPRRAADLQAAGRPVNVRKGVSDETLDRAISEALFTVFPSIHEGYGLPVAESMAHGTPVITSNFGSMAEIASDGGALTIDPSDDQALVDAMRTLLTDPLEIARLRKEIAGRPHRGWQQYADELWAAIVEPELAALIGARPPAGSGTDVWNAHDVTR